MKDPIAYILQSENLLRWLSVFPQSCLYYLCSVYHHHSVSRANTTSGVAISYLLFNLETARIPAETDCLHKFERHEARVSTQVTPYNSDYPLVNGINFKAL